VHEGTELRIVLAAIEVLGRDGARGLTVRAAENAAGVAHGSVRYHFGDHSGLLRAILREIVRQDAEAIPERFEEENIAETITGILVKWSTEDRVRVLARYELMLLGARDDDVRQMFLSAARDFVRKVQAALPGIRAGTAIVAQIDGLLFELMTRGSMSQSELLSAVRGVLLDRSPSPG
jgi:AcrR family transcriptional regulator